MALRALMLKRSIDLKKISLIDLRKKDAEFEARSAELETAIGEVNTDEERTAVEEQVNQYDTDLAAHNSAVAALENDIADLERQLAEEEAKAPTPAAPAAAPTDGERMKNNTMNNRTRFFGMTIAERDAFFADNRVKNLLSEVRACIEEKRAITNVGLVIPDVAMPLVREVAMQSSRLLSRVDHRRIAGTGRVRIMGKIPEAIWTEACGKLNEMSLGFNDAEVDGYKVGGFFAVCNAILEDNDVNLMTEIINALGKAIGKALDRAIIYGTGTKMPMGIVTRLAQTAKPDTYPATAREWKDLHTTNVITGTGKTGEALFAELLTNQGKTINDYADSGLIWVMNQATHTKLKIQSMGKNSNAAIVAGIDNTMPIIGGEIVELPFIPDDNIVAGYFDAYLLAERAGTHLGQSEHVRFLEDQTAFKGTARYDGTPLIPEAFVVMSIGTTAPATTSTFPADTANAAAA